MRVLFNLLLNILPPSIRRIRFFVMTFRDSTYASGQVSLLRNACTKTQQQYTAESGFISNFPPIEGRLTSRRSKSNEGANVRYPRFRGSICSLNHWAGSARGAIRCSSPFETRTIETIKKTSAANQNRKPPKELPVIAPMALNNV